MRPNDFAMVSTLRVVGRTVRGGKNLAHKACFLEFRNQKQVGTTGGQKFDVKHAFSLKESCTAL